MKKSFNLRARFFALVVFATIAFVFAWTYAIAPFKETTNMVIMNGATTLAALTAALILTRVTLFFQRDEMPFMIWLAFAVCMWLWTIAEAYWGYLYTTVGEVPVFSAADVLWFIGYLTLTISLVRQYRLVFFNQTYAIRWAAIGLWFVILVIIETILLVTKSQSPLGDFFRYFYVFTDSAIGLAALYLVVAFRGRALAIPWLTISSFVVTDILYLRLTSTGAYDWVMSGVSVALLADTLYVVAYLIVAWGVFEQYLLLRQSSDPSPT